MTQAQDPACWIGLAKRTMADANAGWRRGRRGRGGRGGRSSDVAGGFRGASVTAEDGWSADDDGYSHGFGSGNGDDTDDSFHRSSSSSSSSSSSTVNDGDEWRWVGEDDMRVTTFRAWDVRGGQPDDLTAAGGEAGGEGCAVMAPSL